MALRGVNLGGWLVVERWMTPSLFEGLDARNEYELSHAKKGQQRVRRHHETFIVEDDIAWLQKHEIKAVRVPIGHWIFGDEPPYVGAIEKLDWLMRVAAQYDIKVLLVLHGAPGAQNSKDHSGSGDWPKRTSKWLQDSVAKKKAIEVLVKIAERYGKDDNLWGIELLNEPDVDTLGTQLVRFYRRAAKAIHPLLHKNAFIVFSDGFRPLLLAGALWPIRLKRRIAVDMHLYYCFGKKPLWRDAMRRVVIKSWLFYPLRLFQPIVVGEWSGMLGHKTTAENTSKFIARQRASYQIAEAEFYWSYKTESGGRWNFRDMTEKNTNK